MSPTRNIKQGDPLLPYLFLFCVEGLFALIQKANESQQLHGVLSCHGGVSISHLLFVDDSLFFCLALHLECSNLLHVLNMYERASGQAINGQKTALFSNPNMDQTVKDDIRRLLNAQIVMEFEKYLGLPMVGGKNKANTFKDLRERIETGVTSWKEKLISKSGRVVLIKTVAQPIPTYYEGPFWTVPRPKQTQEPWVLLLLVLRDWAWFTAAKWADYEPDGAQSRNPTMHTYWQTRNICIEQQENNKGAIRQRKTQSKRQGSLRYCIIFH